MNPRHQVMIEYCDSRGIKYDRHIIPSHIEFRCTSTHSDPRWVLIAYDINEEKTLMFSMNRIIKWKSMRPKVNICDC